METKFIIRNIALILVIIGLFYYFKTTKDDSVEQELLDAELIILLVLSILYTFTHESPLWKQYSWIWRTIFTLTLVAYLIRIVVDQKRGWWNKAVSTMVLIFIFSIKIMGYSAKGYTRNL